MSKVLPVAIHDRPELNLRQGIKSSLNHWRQLIASAYLFYLYVIDGGDNIYSKEVKTGGKVSLEVSVAFANWLAENWGDIANVTSLVRQCPLYVAQMEHLQVGLQLFLKLSKVSFADSSFSDAIERTGGNRFNKALYFSTNMKVLAETISAYPDVDRESFVKGWLSGQDDGKVGNRVKEILAAFTEECQFKIRTQSGELFFQQDGIYDRLRNPHDSVESTDSSEPVGPFRILKSYVKEGMHPYLSEGPNGFVVKSSSEAFTAYADMVQTSLSLIPKRTTIYQEVNQVANEPPVTLLNVPLQLITYGAPGTGKSHKVDGLANNPDVAACVRTTFHPDSDYATFVGAYKPVMEGEKIAYKFRPQAFMNAYVKAWKEMSKPEADGKVKSVVLVIEEINRGNCAQIFGDLFQLLDRGKDGYSTYPIDADADLATWLAEELGKLDADAQERVPPEVRSGEKLVLPPNLYIWATMNTSDQSLFPIDSAFKRRWDWEYVPIAKPDKSGDSDWKERKIEVGDSLFDWWDFLSAINGHIAKATESEDKQLGYFFVKANDATGCISAEQFANKVLFYLYGDVFKSYELPKKDCFQQADNTVLKFRDFFYSEKVEEGEGENRVTHKPGDVKLDVVAAFLRGLKWKEKGVKEEPKGGAADANPD